MTRAGTSTSPTETFENLGIYELVRRRCRYIVACDAGQDGAFDLADLGNAIRKCRVDFGLDIDISLCPRISSHFEWGVRDSSNDRASRGERG